MAPRAKEGNHRIAAIVPAHNGIEDTLRCVASLEESNYPLAAIVVVDDGSVDGTAQRLASDHPRVIVARGDGELWWSGSVNLGLEVARRSSPDYFLLVNQDNVIGPDTVGALVDSALARPGAIIASVVVDADDPSRVGFCGGAFEWSFRTWRMFHWELDDLPTEIETETMTGMGTLIPAGIYDDIGGMDAETFPQYWGDADYALRAREAGYRVFIEPSSRVKNRVGSTGHTAIARRWSFLSHLKRVWDIRSPFDLRTTTTFYLRHCPDRKTLPARIALCYASLALYTAVGDTGIMRLARRLLPSN